MKLVYRLDYTDGTYSKDRYTIVDNINHFKVKVAKLAPFAITPDEGKTPHSISIKDGKKWSVIWSAQNV